MAASNQALDGMSAQDRQKLLDTAKQAGIKGYDTELWINKDGYPVQMNLGIAMPQGKITMNAHYSDYGAKVAVKRPAGRRDVRLRRHDEERRRGRHRRGRQSRLTGPPPGGPSGRTAPRTGGFA